MLKRGLKLWDGDTVVDVEDSTPQSSQFSDVGATAEGLANIVSQGTNVGSLAALNSDSEVGSSPIHELQAEDIGPSRLPFHFNAGAGKIMRRFPWCLTALYIGGF